MNEIAYAKINLALHVRRRMSNGYHELETLFAFISQGDLISVAPATDVTLFLSGPFSKGLNHEENLVLDAAIALKNKFDVKEGAALRLEKILPVAAGIGGGSADAAATLRLLNRFWKLGLTDADLAEIARPLGADVPACIKSKMVLGRGIGQDLEHFPDNDLSGMDVLLVNPLKALSTAEVYRKWDGIDKGELMGKTATELLQSGRNDLQPFAIQLEEAIAPVLSELEKTKPVGFKMSGSGATCFGVYQSEKEMLSAQTHLCTSIPNIWTMTGRIR